MPAPDDASTWLERSSEHPVDVADVQSHLESIYDVQLGVQAEAYVIGSREAAAKLGATGRNDEELLVHEENGELELGLFLAPELLLALKPYSMRTLAPVLPGYTGALNAYCQLAEGVSHFMYVARSAAEGRTVTLLELETQAEIDKFASCLLHLWKRPERDTARKLHHRLFEDVRFNPALDADERWRYGEANRLARVYCQRLSHHYEERRLDRLLSALRYSYRLGAQAKLSHLALAA